MHGRDWALAASAVGLRSGLPLPPQLLFATCSNQLPLLGTRSPRLLHASHVIGSLSNATSISFAYVVH